jgi:nucleoside 2-deoxyribosyltransferase
MVQKTKCVLCDFSDVDMQLEIKQRMKLYQCPRCGNFEISSSLAHQMELGEHSEKRHILSGLSRRAWEQEKQRMERETTSSWTPYRIDENTIPHQLASMTVSLNPLDLMNRLLLLIQDRTVSFREGGFFDFQKEYPLVFARDGAESYYFAQIAEKMGFLESSKGGPIQGNSFLRLTPPGWERVDELRRSLVQSNKVFVAMWFDKTMTPIWEEGFKPELLTLGYDPVRIDFEEHIDRTDDRILAEIRTSGFVVADFTGARSGVYFEAGFAMGLGKPVVWTCRRDWIEKLHFDTRQFNHILWDHVTDLREKLRNRVNGVIRPLL